MGRARDALTNAKACFQAGHLENEKYSVHNDAEENDGKDGTFRDRTTTDAGARVRCT